MLTDFHMPGRTGLDVADAIRARGDPTPIAMISGHAAPDDQRRAVQAGLRFVRKPITFAQFKAAMAEVGQQAGARDKATFPCPLCREVGRVVSTLGTRSGARSGAERSPTSLRAP